MKKRGEVLMHRELTEYEKMKAMTVKQRLEYVTLQMN